MHINHSAHTAQPKRSTHTSRIRRCTFIPYTTNQSCRKCRQMMTLTPQNTRSKTRTQTTSKTCRRRSKSRDEAPQDRPPCHKHAPKSLLWAFKTISKHPREPTHSSPQMDNTVTETGSCTGNRRRERTATAVNRDETRCARSR